MRFHAGVKTQKEICAEIIEMGKKLKDFESGKWEPEKMHTIYSLRRRIKRFKTYINIERLIKEYKEKDVNASDYEFIEQVIDVFDMI